MSRPTNMIRDSHNNRNLARTTAPSCNDGEEDEPERQGSWRVHRKNFDKRY